LSPDGNIIHQDGKIVFTNTAGARLVGAEDPEELIGKPVLDFLHPDYHEMAMRRMRDMLEKGLRTNPVEEKIVRLDGKVVDVEVSGIPTTYRERPAIQLIVIVRDITERKKAEETLEKRLNDLERMHRAFVGRELRMKELKDEIRELRKEHKDKNE
ncbi:MAG: PAS domain S-box protein, partial [Euryarchaeota archaeon]|nr:PAS domain S-box protein [Euryarchaeota archaeon]